MSVTRTQLSSVPLLEPTRPTSTINRAAMHLFRFATPQSASSDVERWVTLFSVALIRTVMWYSAKSAVRIVPTLRCEILLRQQPQPHVHRHARKSMLHFQSFHLLNLAAPRLRTPDYWRTTGICRNKTRNYMPTSMPFRLNWAMFSTKCKRISLV